MLNQEYIKPYGDNLLIYVQVTANASRNKIGSTITDPDNNVYLKVYVAVQPEKGKANQTVMEMLCKHLNLSKNKLELFIGQTCPKKIFMIKK